MVYDKAKWHLNEAFPKDLPSFQSNVHCGFFLGWAINNNLISDDFRDDYSNEITQFNMGYLTGPQLFEISDSVLSSDELNETGNRFAMDYYATNIYFDDYEKYFANGNDCLFRVVDSDENFAVVTQFLNERYATWRKTQASTSSDANSASN